MRESVCVNKCKTSRHHRVTSFTFRSEQPPLLLSCSPDPTPELQLPVMPHLLLALWKLGAAEAQKGEPWGREDLGESLKLTAEAAASSLTCPAEVTPWALSFFSHGLPEFSKKEVGSFHSGMGDSLPLLLPSACWLSFTRSPWDISHRPIPCSSSYEKLLDLSVKPSAQLWCPKAQRLLWNLWCRCRARLKAWSDLDPAIINRHLSY